MVCIILQISAISDHQLKEFNPIPGTKLKWLPMALSGAQHPMQGNSN